MKHRILLPLFAAGFSILYAAPALRFSAVPTVERFPDGSLEFQATTPCLDPRTLSTLSVVFSFDTDLDGITDGNRDSTLLSSAHCDNGMLQILRTFFPVNAGIFTTELKQGNTLLDHYSTPTGGIGSLLSIHRFCARPADGEPEWIEIRNTSATRLTLARVRVEGHLLSGGIGPGANLLVGRDSLELERWQPAADIFVTPSWSYLRNTGDTLRLTWDNSVVLDSVIYGSAVESHEACASAASEENIASASGYDMEASPIRWNPHIEPLVFKVTVPAQATCDLRVYDLDGFGLCTVPIRKKGSSEISLSLSDCPALLNRSGSILLQLQSSGAVSLRKRIRLLNRF